MATIRAQVILPYQSNVPEDVTVSRFHFQTGAAVTEGDLTEINARLLNAYNAITSFISPRISRPSSTVRYYDLDDPEPRVPLREDPLLFDNTAASTSLPQEVALVLSFRGGYTSGVPKARRRNRTYFGPLTTTAATTAAGEPSRPSSTVIDAAIAFAEELATPVAVATVVWIGLSETSSTTFPIQEAWCDNEWDTQRRRGVRATTRVVAPIPPV